jgi:ATP-binding cassette subfamily F protein 3
MAVLLQIRGAEKSFGDQRLLDDAEMTLVDDVKVGFVGRNGAGKSTLLRVILGEEELEKGEVLKHPRLKLGYLRQHDPFQPGESALDYLIRDSGQADWKCGEVAGQFELKGDYLHGPVAALSGGWQTRVKLASLLLHEPNLLLLDEPTNFLDVRTQILLEHFLRSFHKAALIVSHDREFLKATCTQTLDLSRGKLTLYPGKVDAFLEYQAERREHDERVNAAVQSKQRQLQRFIDKNRARASTASQARSKGKQLERLQTIDIAADAPTAQIRAPIVEPRKGPAVRCIDLAIGYPDRQVASHINLEVEHGQRVAVVGDNGQGKTTFLRTLVGSLPPLDGQIKWGHGCEYGVYAQHVYTSLDPRKTVLEYLEGKATPGTTQQMILAVAGALLFRDSHVEKKIAVLSGGERARLCMAGLLLGTYNILVLDEPGNHLDVETVESLAEALLAYRGTVIFTSHDRHFMRRVASSIIEVRAGTAVNYAGDYEAYLYAVNKEIEEGERETRSRKDKADKAKETLSKTTIPRLDDRALQKELRAVEKKIANLDEQRRSLHARLMESTDPEQALQLHQEMTAIAASLEASEQRWYELNEQQS